MTGKEISVSLSIMTFIQLLVLAVGGGIISEMQKPVSEKHWLAFLIIALTILAPCGVLIYFKIYIGASKHKK